MKSKLVKAILEQLGASTLEEAKQELENVTQGGANCGISGFIYHSELLEFFRSNRGLIKENLQELASDLGEDCLKMIQSYNCLKDCDLSLDDIAEVFYCGNIDGECGTMIVDALCWSVLENLAFSLDGQDDEEIKQVLGF